MSAYMLAWDVGSFLENLSKNVQSWFGIIVVLIGAIMVGVAIYQVATGLIMMICAIWKIASGLISHGKKQTNWFVVILLFLLGGAFFLGGFNWALDIAQGGKETIDKMGSGSGGAPDEVIRLFTR